MKNCFVRVVSICIAMLVLMPAIEGCSNTKDAKDSKTSTATTAGVTGAQGKDYTELLGSVKDSSDLPDWTGKQLSLRQWYAHGSGDVDHTIAENDVVGPEAKRVTGVELNVYTSYDNAGNTVDVKMALLAAANDWPDIIQTSSPDQLKQMILADKLYDLSDLLDKYCPDLVKKFDVKKYPKIMHKITADDTGISKKIFFAPVNAGISYARQIADESAEFDPVKWSNMQMPRPQTDWPRIWVRDDILKRMYPNAKSQDELEAIFEAKGTFTREQIFDVPLKNADDFYKFLTDMKALIDKENIKIGNKPVEVTYAAFGGDNWQLMSCLLPMIHGIPGLNYYTYYDKETGKVEYTVKQDFYKGYISEFRKLITSGVVSKESLLDSSAIFTEKLNSGLYAITYAWSKPDENALKAAGQTFRYRQLWVDTTFNYDKFTTIDSAPSTDQYIGIFKDSIAEEDVPQILGWINYMVSDIGEKLVSWGPRSAGLFTETDGKRVYTDKELENNMAYGADNKKNLTYGLYNAFMASLPIRQSWPYYPVSSEGNMNHPMYMYAGAPKDKGQTDAYFQPGILTGEAREDHVVLAFISDFLPDYSTQWEVVTKGRDAYERALTATLAAHDDAHFEKLWQTMLDTANSTGMNDKMLEEINKIFNAKNPTFAEDAAKVRN